MAQTNKTPARRERLGAYAKAVLTVLGVSVAVVALVALPGLGVVLKEFKRQGRKPYSRKSMRTTVTRLARRGLIRVVERGDELCVQLTARGRRAARHLAADVVAIQPQKRWDKKWRLVAFDIPEERRSARLALRTRMRSLGFVRLQKSLFAYPYPCEDVIAGLTELFGIGAFVQYITAESFNGEGRLRKHFGLV